MNKKYFATLCYAQIQTKKMQLEVFKAEKMHLEHLRKLTDLTQIRVVTRPRGSWRRDAFGVVQYRPELGKRGIWYWRHYGNLILKLSKPQLRRSEFVNVDSGSIHNHPLYERQKCGWPI